MPEETRELTWMISRKRLKGHQKGEILVPCTTKLLSGNNYKPLVLVLDKSGKRISSEQEESARWVEHFQEVLNQPDPEEAATLPPADDILNINVGPPTAKEVMEAIKAMKTDKSCRQ